MKLYIIVGALIFGGIFALMVFTGILSFVFFDIGDIWGVFDLDELFGPPRSSLIVWTLIWAAIGGFAGYKMYKNKKGAAFPDRQELPISKPYQGNFPIFVQLGATARRIGFSGIIAGILSGVFMLPGIALITMGVMFNLNAFFDITFTFCPDKGGGGLFDIGCIASLGMIFIFSQAALIISTILGFLFARLAKSRALRQTHIYIFLIDLLLILLLFLGLEFYS